MFLLEESDFVGFATSYPGGQDINTLHLPSQVISTIVSGETLGGGQALSIRDVEIHFTSQQLLFQASVQRTELDLTLSNYAYLVSIECDSISGVCANVGQTKLGWINSGQHSLSWTLDGAILDSYTPGLNEAPQITIRNINGNVLNAITVSDFDWNAGMEGPILMSADMESILFTYGIGGDVKYPICEDKCLRKFG